ncbi:lmo0937 family membrane protein [Emticicia soli]|uniref:Lmo0937 family membrane protein n=1 Tax=Emticicia soli TaxID=2027878 RepID=A0ABW5JE69_9BACT
MSKLLYLLAVILIISWAVGLFALGADYIIHALLIMAVIIILKINKGNKVIK